MTKTTGITIPKNFRKVKSGYDQEFTLPKGTSAAPIKQSKVKKTDVAFVIGAGTGAAATKATSNKKSKRPKGGWTPGV